MKAKNEPGIALIMVLLILILLGALLQAFFVNLDAQQKLFRSNFSSEESAFSGALSGLEIATAELADTLAKGNLTQRQADDIAASLKGTTVGSGNDQTSITDAKVAADAEAETVTLTEGNFAGLTAQVTPYTITVTARTKTGEEVTLKRTVQIVYIPIFQFGMFSESDLAFFPGGYFNFGGRVHTNGDLYLSGADLRLTDYTSAVGKIIRKRKPNEVNVDSTNAVQIVTAKKADGTVASSRGLKIGEGNDTLTDSAWARGIAPLYNRFLLNGATGAKPLNLPLVSGDARPIDIIRLPPRNEDRNDPDVFRQRYFSMASLRVLLADEKGDIDNLPTVTRTAPPVPLDGSFSHGGATYQFATSPGGGNYKVPNGAPLVGGYIKIEMKLDNGGWVDVTREILALGATGPAMEGGRCTGGEAAGSSILRVQRYKPDLGACSPANGRNLWPNVLFDTREAVDSDDYPMGNDSLYLGGVMHYVELDIAKLCAWLKRKGDAVAHDTGYVVYFSDRRGSRAAGRLDKGEYAYEQSKDKHNRYADTNGNGFIDQAVTPTLRVTDSSGRTYASSLVGGSAKPTTKIPAALAKVNPPVFFRRALKLIHGEKMDLGVDATDNLPWGLAIASENPVYVQGNYNANTEKMFSSSARYDPSLAEIKDGGWSVPASISADAVTMLSNSWRDADSFAAPYNSRRRMPTTTYYRAAIIAGKNKNFPFTKRDFGTSGGAHNFLRMLEYWSSDVPLWYRGSIISLYYAQQASSAFKVGTAVYFVPKREFTFETEFLDIRKLPPCTPMFREIDILSFTREFGA
ncbi:MAG: hypothetical protein LBT74_13850 [Acidobacteriota bacterium]|nr:hypothetical protein [Acidobacteriota bacterium]